MGSDRVLLPAGLARFNRVVTNPIQGVWAWLLPPWAMIVHRGRKTGRVYRTPVIAFRRGNLLAVLLFYGDRTDWVRNLLAAERGEIQRGGRFRRLSNPRVIESADGVDGLPQLGRLGIRHVNVLIAEIE